MRCAGLSLTNLRLLSLGLVTTHSLQCPQTASCALMPNDAWPSSLPPVSTGITGYAGANASVGGVSRNIVRCCGQPWVAMYMYTFVGARVNKIQPPPTVYNSTSTPLKQGFCRHSLAPSCTTLLGPCVGPSSSLPQQLARQPVLEPWTLLQLKMVRGCYIR